MTNVSMPNHPVQIEIIRRLIDVESARFRDLRPTGIDSNHYTYHLKKLIQNNYVSKTESGYTLGPKGMAAVDRSDAMNRLDSMTPSMIAFVIQNAEGDVLLSQNNRQPFIDKWSLPMGYYESSSRSVFAAAKQVSGELFGVADFEVERAGSCFVRVLNNQEVIYHRHMQVFRFESEIDTAGTNMQWVRPHKLDDYELFPATKEVIARTFFRDADYFEEYTVEF